MTQPEYEKSKDRLEKAILIDPAEHRAYIEMGHYYRDLRQREEAIKMYKKAIELEPENIEAYIELANCSAYWGEKRKVNDKHLPVKVIEKNPNPEGRPNILLFSIDTLRADRLSCYGNKRETTPFIDRFTTEAVLFENALSQSPHTAPSHMSIFTALMPDVHLVANWGIRKVASQLPFGITTMAEILKNSGYYTVGFHAPVNLAASLGFNRGFDYYSNVFDERKLSAGELPEGIKKWIDESKKNKKPLFLFLHHLYCHSPYLFGLKEHRTRFLAEKVEGLPVRIEDIDEKNYHESFWKKVDLGKPAHREHMLALYDGGVCFSDYLFERTIDLLKKEGCYDNFIIILLSDHGEEFFEHGGIEHERLFIEQLHVPLIIKFPGGHYAGMRIKDYTRLVDLMPTLLEYLKIPVTSKIQGISFLPLITKKGIYNPLMVSHAVRGGKVRIMKNGLVYSDEPNDNIQEWLFDATDDPKEQNNLAGSKSEAIELMREITQRVKEERKNYVDLIEPADRGPSLEMDGELEERLKSLGYLH